jgi:4-amino-4-deoxy-L-arabinose transferase-like glycosyltransferase
VEVRSTHSLDSTIASPGRGLRWAVYLLAGVLIVSLLGIGLAAAHLRTDETDCWLFAYYADQMLQGEQLYADLWDNKPPGIFWINALGLQISGGRYGGVVALCVLASAVAVVVFFLVARDWYGRTPAIIGTVLASLYLSHQMYRGGTNRPESFVVLFDLAAVYWYQRGLRLPNSRLWFLAGGMAGLSFLFKQTGIAAFGAILAHQLFLAVRARGIGWERLRVLAWIGLGWIGASGLAIIALLLSSDLGWAWDAIVLFVFRFAAAKHGGMPMPTLFGMTEHLDILALPLILALAAVAYASARWLRRNPPNEEQVCAGAGAGIPILLVAWFLAAVLIAFSGPNKAYHYMLPALSPLLLLATMSIGLLVSRGADHERLPPSVLRYVAVLWFAYMGFAPLKHQIYQLNNAVFTRLEEPDPFGDATMVDFVNSITEEQDRIFLWRYLPHVYWASGRSCGTRFHSMLNAAQLGRHGQYIVDDVLASLVSDPPKLVTLQLRRARELRDADPGDGPDFRALATCLCERYRPFNPRNPDSVLIRRE